MELVNEHSRYPITDETLYAISTQLEEYYDKYGGLDMANISMEKLSELMDEILDDSEFRITYEDNTISKYGTMEEIAAVRALFKLYTDVYIKDVLSNIQED